MIIYISMFIVLAAFYFLHSVYNHKHNLKNDDKPNKAVAFIVFAYIVFWAGIRSGFMDTSAYIKAYNLAAWNDIYSLDFSFNTGWGYDIISILFKQVVSSNYQYWLMFVAIISGLCVGITFYRYSQNYFYSTFLFLATADFTWLMNGIRQFLVVTILFAATPLIEKNKWFKYILLVLLCSTIHGTALLMIPVYFFVRAKPWKPRTIILLVLVLFVLLFTGSFTGLLEDVFQETKYENISQQFMGDDGVNHIRVLVFSITTVLAFLARKQLPQDDIKINIFVNMSLVTSGLYLISMATSGILLGRLPIYTQLYQYMLLPYIYNDISDQRTKNLIYMASIGLFMIYFKISADGLYYISKLTGYLS